MRHGDTRWGALGLSREEALQWKLLAFSSLSALLSDYREAYRGCGHEVTKVRIGLPMPHDDDYKGKVRPLHGDSGSALSLCGICVLSDDQRHILLMLAVKWCVALTTTCQMQHMRAHGGFYCLPAHGFQCLRRWCGGR